MKLFDATYVTMYQRQKFTITKGYECHFAFASKERLHITALSAVVYTICTLSSSFSSAKFFFFHSYTNLGHLEGLGDAIRKHIKLLLSHVSHLFMYALHPGFYFLFVLNVSTVTLTTASTPYL